MCAEVMRRSQSATSLSAGNTPSLQPKAQCDDIPCNIFKGSNAIAAWLHYMHAYLHRDRVDVHYPTYYMKMPHLASTISRAMSQRCRTRKVSPVALAWISLPGKKGSKPVVARCRY